jgi:hypothetical protein
MSTTSGYTPASEAGTSRAGQTGHSKGYGWMVFAGIILSVAGVLNVIYGIAAISNSKFFIQDTHYVFSDLKTWGWITLIFGVLQLIAAFSLWSGNAFGRIFAIAAASVSAIVALLSLPAYPFLSLAIFALDIMVIYGCAVYQRDEAY